MGSFRAFAAAITLMCVLAPGQAPAADASWPKSVVIATASPGGSYYLFGQALSAMLSQSIGVEVVAQPTQGPLQNIVLLEERQAALGMITSGIGLQAWNGAEWTKGQQYRSMRVIFPMYDTQFHIAAPKKGGIATIADLNGKRLGIGPRGGTGGTYVPAIFRLLGVSAVLRNSSFEDIATQILLTDDLDGIVVLTGAPLPALMDIEQHAAMNYIGLSPQQIERVRKDLPEMTDAKIPARAYPSLAQDYPTVGLYNFTVAHKDLPDDLIYRIVKAVFEGHDALVKAHPAARETMAANINRNTLFPVHPGAVRYYREIGIAVSDQIPIN